MAADTDRSDADQQRVSALLVSSTVPVCVTLAPADVMTPTPPLPVYLNVPRASLLASIWQTLIQAFTPFVAEFGRPPPLWLVVPSEEKRVQAGEKKIVALPWHAPVGAIVDAHASTVSGGTPELPFRVIAHVSPPPDKTVLWRLTSAKDCDILAQQCLKQGLMARFDDLKPFYKAATADIAGYVSSALAVSASSVAAHAKFRKNVEAMLSAGRSLAVAKELTPQQPVTVYRDGSATTIVVETPFASDAIKHIAEADREAEEVSAVQIRQASETALADDEAKADEQGTAAAAAVRDDDSLGGTDVAAAATSPLAKSGEAPATSAAAASPPRVAQHRTELAHDGPLTIAHIVAAVVPEGDRDVDGCNLRSGTALDAPPAEPLRHPTLRVTVAGLEPPLNVPLAWAMEHLVYADMALHVVVAQQPSA